MTRKEIRLAGFGGQGLLLAGIILGRTAALYENKHAAQTQSYGTEARGGASQCNVVIDEKEITYVGVIHPDLFLVMSQEAYDKLVGDVKEGGLVFYDSDLVRPDEKRGLRQIPVSCTTTARNLGREMVANMVMLGAAVRGARILDPEMVKRCLTETVPPGTEELNLKAFGAGQDRVRRMEEGGEI